LIFFAISGCNLFALKPDDGPTKTRIYCLNSRGAAPPEPAPAKGGARVTVTLDIDADVLDWLKGQPLDWQREINNLARFYMETSNQPVPPPLEFDRFT
jgi:uncharacterized protein (DUF4415 family)